MTRRYADLGPLLFREIPFRLDDGLSNCLKGFTRQLDVGDRRHRRRATLSCAGDFNLLGGVSRPGDLGEHGFRQHAIDVVAPEVRIAVGGQHLEHAVLDFQDGNVEGAAAQVVHRDGAAIAFVEPVRERCRRRLVDDAEHLETGETACVPCRRPLRVVEVRRHGDDSAIHLEVELTLLAEVLLGPVLQFLEDECGDLRRGELTVTKTDADDTAQPRRTRGTCRNAASSRTSSTPRPMNRFTEYTVRDGAVSRRRCASRPTNTVLSSPSDTTDGTSPSPDASRITTGTSPCT